MASNLPSLTELAQYNAALIRAARLDADCSPTGGTNSGYVTIGLATATASADVEEGTQTRPKNANGVIMYTINNDDIVTGYNLTGEFITYDPEGEELFFAGSTILGAVGGPYAGDVIGYNHRGPDDTPNNGVYLEIITRQVGRGAGQCQATGTDFPPYVGHIFPRAKMTVGDRTFEEGEGRLAWTAKVTNNPALFNGPWNDYPGAGYISPTAPHIEVGYSQAQYDAILATAGAGYKTLPAGS